MKTGEDEERSSVVRFVVPSTVNSQDYSLNIA